MSIFTSFLTDLRRVKSTERESQRLKSGLESEGFSPLNFVIQPAVINHIPLQYPITNHSILFPAMSTAGKLYFDAVSKIGENAAVSPVSRELGKVQCSLVL